MPDLPEQSRAPREGPDPSFEGSEVVSERSSVETAFGAPDLAPALSGNGTRTQQLGDTAAADTATTADPIGEPGSTVDRLDREGLEGLDGERGNGDSSGDGGDDGFETADDEGGQPPDRGRRARRSGWRSVAEWALVIGGALLVALVVRTFLVQAFWIPSASMEPTLQEGDRVLVNKLSYDLHDVRHGDVIVFERPDEPSDVPHPENEIPDLIKRVIGLPGDIIEGRDGIVYINDERIDEPYLAPDTPTTDLPRQEVPDGHLFVMGDNRTNSHDSRKFGAIDESSIVGRAFLRIYPLDDIGGL
ncbi:MAG TPA: signal peptidase I [Acidimicrobiales bacterium]|nr:signal peptidase I [Acidimicrobiales bacterium]